MNEISVHDDNVNLEDIYKKIHVFQTEEGVCFRVSYISDFSSSKIIREIVKFLTTEYHINPPWTARLMLIIDELNNNAIEYGSRPEDYNTITFDFKNLETDKVNVCVSVEDSGK